MKHLSSLLVLLAACRTMANERAHDDPQPSQLEHPMTAPVPFIPGYSQQQNQPYSGYPGPVGRTDAGAPDAGPAVAPADAGPPPPNTAMPATRPLYPDAGAPDAGAVDGGR